MEERCIYKKIDEPWDGLFLSQCGKEFWLERGKELYEFCPYCGKEIEEQSDV